MTRPPAAYISCGTWGLVGRRDWTGPSSPRPAGAANFTNEAGVDGRIRFLHNVMGLWLLNESIRDWEPRRLPAEPARRLLDAAAGVDGPVAVFDPNDPRFLPPGDMPSRIAALCRGTACRTRPAAPRWCAHPREPGRAPSPRRRDGGR